MINAYDAIKSLNSKNIFPSLISMHSIKPLDKNLLKRIFKNYSHIVVLEEHSEIGGLAAAISEFYTDNKFNKNLFLKINIGNQFVLKPGHQNHAFEKLNLNAKKYNKE